MASVSERCLELQPAFAPDGAATNMVAETTSPYNQFHRIRPRLTTADMTGPGPRYVTVRGYGWTPPTSLQLAVNSQSEPTYCGLVERGSPHAEQKPRAMRL